jgi:hypothetical protein
LPDLDLVLLATFVDREDQTVAILAFRGALAT